MSMNGKFTKMSMLLIHQPDEAAKMFMEIDDHNERAELATWCLKFIVDTNNLSGSKLLFAHGADHATNYPGSQLLLTVMRRPRDPQQHREMIKMLVERGIKLDSSNVSCGALFDYVMRGIQKIKNNSNFGFAYSHEKSVAELIEDLDILLANGGHLTFPQILENSEFVTGLGSLLAWCGGDANINSPLLRYFLDLGMDANTQMTRYVHLEQAGKIEYRSLLSLFLDWQKWEAASLLLEYGAYQSGEIVSSYSGNSDPSITFADFSTYLDNFKDRANANSSNNFCLLEDGLKKKKLQRRQEICRQHLKPVLDLACNSYNSFDSLPLATIISEYVL